MIFLLLLKCNLNLKLGKQGSILRGTQPHFRSHRLVPIFWFCVPVKVTLAMLPSSQRQVYQSDLLKRPAPFYKTHAELEKYQTLGHTKKMFSKACAFFLSFSICKWSRNTKEIFCGDLGQFRVTVLNCPQFPKKHQTYFPLVLRILKITWRVQK